MPGTYNGSYWFARLTTDKGISSNRMDLETYLTRTIKRLGASRPFISRLRATGGGAELFVGLFGNRNFGVELHPTLLASAARLGVTLSLDVYP